MKNTEYEVGKIYFLFSERYNVSNRVKYLGKRTYQDGKKTIHELEYAGRGKNPDKFSLHDFELNDGKEILTETHKQGQLIS